MALTNVTNYPVFEEQLAVEDGEKQLLVTTAILIVSLYCCCVYLLIICICSYVKNIKAIKEDAKQHFTREIEKNKGYNRTTTNIMSIQEEEDYNELKRILAYDDANNENKKSLKMNDMVSVHSVSVISN